MDTKQEKLIENDDVIILGSCEMPKPMISHVKYKKRRTRMVSFKDPLIKDILVVTQKVEVKKRKKGCIININTNVTGSNGQEKKCGEHNICVETKNICMKRPPGKERVVPNCLRPKCKSVKPKVEDYKIKCHTIKKEPLQKSSVARHQLPKALSQQVSPVSSPPLKNSLSYDDISLDSFPDYSETELDTLIKRSKQREKKNQTYKTVNIYIEPVSTSTPIKCVIEENHLKEIQYTNSIEDGSTIPHKKSVVSEHL